MQADLYQCALFSRKVTLQIFISDNQLGKIAFFLVKPEFFTILKKEYDTASVFTINCFDFSAIISPCDAKDITIGYDSFL